MVADLRGALGRFPNDEYLTALITDLRAHSAAFAGLWEQRPAVRAPSRRKTFNPEIGPITLDCDTLDVHGSDLSVIVYTAPAWSPEAGGSRCSRQSSSRASRRLLRRGICEIRDAVARDGRFL